MSKITWKPSNMLYPIPAVMVSCGSSPSEYNIITIAWTGTVNSQPPMTYISVRKERHSYDILKKNKDFVINLTTEDLAFATDFAGVKSGSKIDKFESLNLTPEASEKVNSPRIKESPVNIECQIKDVVPLGSHDMFLAEIVSISVDEKYFDAKGKFHLEAARPIAYMHGSYYKLGEAIGSFGYSVRKKKVKKNKYKKSKQA